MPASADLLRPPERLRRFVAGRQAQAAERIAGLIRSVPERRLEQLMQSPAGRPILEAIFWQLPRQVDRTRAAGATASVRWEITRRGAGQPLVYGLELADGRCQVRRGPDTGEPRVTITVDAAEFLRIAVGASDPMRAYFSGRISVAGDIMTAAKLGTLFVVPGRSGG